MPPRHALRRVADGAARLRQPHSATAAARPRNPRLVGTETTGAFWCPGAAMWGLSVVCTACWSALHCTWCGSGHTEGVLEARPTACASEQQHRSHLPPPPLAWEPDPLSRGGGGHVCFFCYKYAKRCGVHRPLDQPAGVRRRSSAVQQPRTAPGAAAAAAAAAGGSASGTRQRRQQGAKEDSRLVEDDSEEDGEEDEEWQPESHAAASSDSEEEEEGEEEGAGSDGEAQDRRPRKRQRLASVGAAAQSAGGTSGRAGAPGGAEVKRCEHCGALRPGRTASYDWRRHPVTHERLCDPCRREYDKHRRLPAHAEPSPPPQQQPQQRQRQPAEEQRQPAAHEASARQAAARLERRQVQQQQEQEAQQVAPSEQHESAEQDAQQQQQQQQPSDEQEAQQQMGAAPADAAAAAAAAAAPQDEPMAAAAAAAAPEDALMGEAGEGDDVQRRQRRREKQAGEAAELERDGDVRCRNPNCRVLREEAKQWGGGQWGRHPVTQVRPGMQGEQTGRRALFAHATQALA